MPNDTRVAKWGSSLAVRIPQAIVTKARLAEGDRLSLILAADGSIVMRSRQRKYSLDQLVAGIRSGNRHHEIDWGVPTGWKVTRYSLRRAVAGSRRLARRTGG
jgi:antitoxin MazE